MAFTLNGMGMAQLVRLSLPPFHLERDDLLGRPPKWIRR